MDEHYKVLCRRLDIHEAVVVGFAVAYPHAQRLQGQSRRFPRRHPPARHWLQPHHERVHLSLVCLSQDLYADLLDLAPILGDIIIVTDLLNLRPYL